MKVKAWKTPRGTYAKPHSKLFQNEEKDEFGCVAKFRMYDLIHDLAVSVAGFKYKVDDSSSETCREFEERVGHLSFSKEVKFSEDLPPALLKMKKKLQSFIMLAHFSLLKPRSGVSGFCRLRV